MTRTERLYLPGNGLIYFFDLTGNVSVRVPYKIAVLFLVLRNQLDNVFHDLGFRGILFHVF